MHVDDLVEPEHVRRRRAIERTAAPRATAITRWYPATVSDKPPQNYMIHTVVLFVVLVAAMVWFLARQWG